MKTALDLILSKREGNSLSKSELNFFISGYLSGTIPVHQMSALLMAIFFRGMTDAEISAFTEVFIESGTRIEFPADLKTVDKHSTGGVGDKISLILAPAVAACGVFVPMISGRGLGHTGGTLDKLEAIPGFRTQFSESEFKDLVLQNGFAIISQSEDLVPADRNIYALRNLTGTVESRALITASIMSKKIAEGAKNLVIDLKVGSGAFMKDLPQAYQLAEKLVKTGADFEQRVSVVFSNMNSPLGESVGNALEIQETIEVLKGRVLEDVNELVEVLGAQMVVLAGQTADEEEARELIKKSLQDGTAFDRFRSFVKAQGGDPQVCDNPELLPQAKYKIPITCSGTGWISTIDCHQIGSCLTSIGAGRKSESDVINYAVGARFTHQIGAQVNNGTEIGQVFADDLAQGEECAKQISPAFQISSRLVNREPLILDLWSGSTLE